MLRSSTSDADCFQLFAIYRPTQLLYGVYVTGTVGLHLILLARSVVRNDACLTMPMRVYMDVLTVGVSATVGDWLTCRKSQDKMYDCEHLHIPHVSH